MTTGIPAIFFLVWSFVSGPFLLIGAFSPEPAQGARGGNRTREPNLHVPNLYADKIDFIATLVDLPGSKKKES